MSAKTSKASLSKIKYTNEPLGDIKVIKDFLPSPAEISFNEEAVKVTLALSKKVLIFSMQKLLRTIHNTSA